MAAHGLALITINAVGLGLGPGTLVVNLVGGQSTTFPSGGRSFDQNGDGLIGSGAFPTGEGSESLSLRSFIRPRDAARQTAVDLMQLARVIEVGMDVDGDSARDLDPGRIYYYAWSYGTNHGTMFSAIEPLVRAAVVIAAGGGSIDSFRLSPGGRPAVGSYLDRRTPSLLNPPGLASLDGVPVAGPPELRFDENVPLRSVGPVINDVAGAMEIQRVFDNTQWTAQANDPTAYAPHLNKPVIVQFARGDQNVTNPMTSGLVRAGDLSANATLFRNDLAYLQNPVFTKNPHDFSIRTNPPQSGEPLAVALATQQQTAEFFASDGTAVADPDGFLSGGCGCLFDVPIGPLPEDLGFIP